MVVSKEKDAKRKRKESPIIESSPEMPKRTKVQAQRKFAQGQHAPPSSSSYSFPTTAATVSTATTAATTAAAQSAAVNTTIREPPPELITKRPNPEDFLTFLCFRGTPVLPTKLDFLNQNKNSTTIIRSARKESLPPPPPPLTTNDLDKKTITSGSGTTTTTTSPQTRASTSKAQAISTQTDNLSPRISPGPHKVKRVPSTTTIISGGRTGGIITTTTTGGGVTTVTEGSITTTTTGPAIVTTTVNFKDNKKLSPAVAVPAAGQSKAEIIPFAVRKRAEQTTEGNKNLTTNMKKIKSKTTTDRAAAAAADASDASSPLEVIITAPTIKNSKDNGRKSMRTRGKNHLDDNGSENNEPEPEPEPQVKTIKTKEITDKNFVVSKGKSSKVQAKRKQPIAATNTIINTEQTSDKVKKTLGKIRKSNTKVQLRRLSRLKTNKSVIGTTVEKIVAPLVGDTLSHAEPIVGRMTRQRAFFEPVKVPPKPPPPQLSDETTTEESKKIEPHSQNTKNHKKLIKIEEIIDFSSEDEQPLAKTLQVKKKLKKSSSKSPQKVIKKSPLNNKIKTAGSVMSDNNGQINDEDKKQILKKSLATNVPKVPNSDVCSMQEDDRLHAGGGSKSTISQIQNDQNHPMVSSNSKLTTKSTPKKTCNKIIKNDLNKLIKSENISFDSIGKLTTTTTATTTTNPILKKKRKKGADADISQQSQTDASETDIKTGRPTRKTKEAATIYMELIGQKLNLGEFDEDNFSMDSFPELPNVKETQKMETELKKNVGKLKTTQALPVIVEVNKETNPNDPNSKKEAAKLVAGNRKKRVLKKKSQSAVISPPVTGSRKKLKTTENKSTITENKRKSENNFSDSDDEPLAIKLSKTSEKDFEHQVETKENSALQSPIAAAATSAIHKIIHENQLQTKPIESELPSNLESNKLFNTPKLISPPNVQSTITSKLKPSPNSGQLASPVSHTPKHHHHHQQQLQQQHHHHHHPTPSSPVQFIPLESYPSPKINPTFLTPKFDRNLERRPPPNTANDAQKNLSFPSPSAQASMNTPAAAKQNDSNTNTPKSTSPSNNSTANAIANILATNLMPSKEESGKIFGIASVSLAQSSGPDNTKCTLGKCGSVHKPVLGPVVPTESYLGEQLSSKERRKAKVNMTHEQIQKWLLECSSTPDIIIDDLDDDIDEILKPTLFALTPPPPPHHPLKDDKESTSTSSKITKQDLSKAESAWSGKGPSLKATPVVAKEEAAVSNFTVSPIQELLSKKEDETLTPPSMKTSSAKRLPVARRPKKKVVRETKSNATKPEVVVTETKEISVTNPISPPPITPITPIKKTPKNQTSVTKFVNKKQQKEDLIKESKQNDETMATVATVATIPTTPPQTFKTTPKRTPVYSAKPPAVTSTENKRNKLLPPKTNTNPSTTIGHTTFTAFSPDNEKSVYSFDKEDDDLPPPLLLTKPFRRHSGRDSHQDEQQNNSSNDNKTTNKDKTIETKSISLLTQNNSPDDKKKLGNKKNLDNNSTAIETIKKKYTKKGFKNIESKRNTNEFVSNDSEGETFYIPLQGATVRGTSGVKSDLVQAVEVKVKVGREGPDGPNQRFCVQATLVTKSQMGTTNSTTTTAQNTTTTTTTNVIDSSDINKKDLSASLAAIAGSSSGGIASNSKSVPIGTVTPRFKSANSIDQQPASVSNPSAGTTILQRVNSNSSLFSGSAKSRAGGGGGPNNNTSSSNSKKHKDDAAIKMCNNTAFPRHDDPSQMVEAPVFRPTEKEFNDPMEFIERITPIAARFGICKIIPPASFKPECRVSDDMRFSAYNQYVHKMLHRWGPSVKEFHAIKKHCGTQQVSLTPFPLIGQMEVDLPRLYHTVQELGGLQEVMEKKKWTRVADEMCIPKLAQDRATRLDDIYCKYLLPYDTLSTSERQKLFDEVEADWAKREARARRNADHCLNSDSDSNEDDEDEIESTEDSEEEDLDGVSMECIVKGKSMPLKQFFRIARNTMSLWFKNTEPTVADVEAEFWRHVAVRDSHVCVHSGSIDSSGWGYGFPSPGPKGKGSPCAKHPWNLKVLTNNPGSVLRSLGPVMGVTVPTLHVGMLFSACCWYRDPHGLSWIEYLHTGANKIWYGIPDEQSSNFRSALTALIPTHCQNKTIWLPCDTAMVPPHMLTDRGVSLCRIEQKPGEFVVIFPRAYTSSLSTGYVVSESVYFATSSWLDLAKEDFRDIHDSCEPAMFSLEQLLFAVASDQRVAADILLQCLPMINEVFEKEQAAREQLKATGVKSIEKLLSDKTNKSKKKPVIPQFTEDDNECDLCRANLYISMVKTNDGNNTYCLQHALKNLNKGNILADQCKLIFTYGIEDIEELIKKLKERLAHKTKSTFAFNNNNNNSGAGGGGASGNNTSKKK